MTKTIINAVRYSTLAPYRTFVLRALYVLLQTVLQRPLYMYIFRTLSTECMYITLQSTVYVYRTFNNTVCVSKTLYSTLCTEHFIILLQHSCSKNYVRKDFRVMVIVYAKVYRLFKTAQAHIQQTMAGSPISVHFHMKHQLAIISRT